MSIFILLINVWRITLLHTSSSAFKVPSKLMMWLSCGRKLEGHACRSHTFDFHEVIDVLDDEEQIEMQNVSQRRKASPELNNK